ncbi:FG-GAP and VCBS repeat-containing protein [Streptomyces sp. NPDC059076]|uniref:FG-GAP and VCBS repeat-containing protein n=1 Tax=unclassified Streptomyces TaxID=2593676 RepID=UPI00368ABA81
MHRHLRLTLATAVSVALTGGLLAVTAGAASAATKPAKYPDDFNGDGYRDFAAIETMNTPRGGAVKVIFGTAKGPGTKTQVISQSSPGVPGSGETDDMFGENRAAADFNGDGYGDLAVSASFEDVGKYEDQGAVTILWGSKNGLSGGTVVPSKAGAGHHVRFGRSLATGDFNGDGRPELAVIGNRRTYVYQGTFTPKAITGPVASPDRTALWDSELVAGAVTKDRATDLVVLGVSVTPERQASEAWFLKGGTKITAGKSLRLGDINDDNLNGVVADFNKDGYGDIAIGNPWDSKDKGAVTVWSGGGSGPGSSKRITQSTAGIESTPEAPDSFGASLTAGDVNRDGYPDLAFGAPGEKLGSQQYAGALHILRSGKGGLSGSGAQYITRTSAGVPGSISEGDTLGALVRLRDMNGDGHLDLIASSSGSSLLMLGGKSGISTQGTTEIEEELNDGSLQ